MPDAEEDADAAELPSVIPESRNQRWTSCKETRLISLYERHRLLWDSRHPYYRNKDRRERAMRNIAKGLQDEFDVTTVKNKIKWLRDYFVKELKRELGVTVKKSAYEIPPSRGYVSRWEHFNKWEFLREVFTAGIGSPPAANGQNSGNQEDSQDKRPPPSNEESREAEMRCSVRDVSTADGTPQTPTPPPRKDAESSPSPVTALVCVPNIPSHTSGASTPPLLVNGKRFPRDCESAHKSQKQRQDVVPVFLTGSSHETMRDGSPATPLNGLKQEQSNECAFAEVCHTPSFDPFCLSVIWHLRQMNSYQRDLAMLRIRQVLFEAKYAADTSAAAEGAAARSSALSSVAWFGGAERQEATITSNSPAPYARPLLSPIETGNVSCNGITEKTVATKAESA